MVSFKFMMEGEEQELEAEITKEAPGEEDHLPLHIAAAGEAIMQQIKIAGR